MSKLLPRWQRILDYFLLTEEQWKAIYNYQKGLCAICGHKLKKANTDHCHKTGLVRGLLCARCNRALGRFADDLARLQAAVAYLLHPPATEALGGPHYGLPGRIGTKKMRRLAAARKRA